MVLLGFSLLNRSCDTLAGVVGEQLLISAEDDVIHFHQSIRR